MTDNEIIAKFMGLDWQTMQVETPSDDYEAHELVPMTVNNLSYDTSWDWLMPVVEKIESETIHPQFDFSLHLERRHCDITCVLRPSGVEPPPDIVLHLGHDGDSKIELVYKAVVEFIKWYDLQTKEK